MAKPDSRDRTYPPRGMRRETAAWYVGVGVTKFDEMVADGRMPKPKRVDGCVIWDRFQLDAAFTDLREDKAVNPLDRMFEKAPFTDWGAVTNTKAVACTTALARNHLRKEVATTTNYDAEAYERWRKGEIPFSALSPGKYPNEMRIWAEGEWEEIVRKSPLTKLERSALEGYVKAKGTISYIKGAGPATVDRLKARGFIEIVKERGEGGLAYYGITPAGEAEWQKIAGPPPG